MIVPSREGIEWNESTKKQSYMKELCEFYVLCMASRVGARRRSGHLSAVPRILD